jgi:hypothetical protein
MAGPVLARVYSCWQDFPRGIAAFRFGKDVSMSTRKIATAFLLTFCLAACPRVFAQAAVAPATDSQTAVQYAHAAETDPLTQTASQQRKEAINFVENDHQTDVLLCAPIFSQMKDNHSSNSGEIIRQYIASSAVFVYEHPQSATDKAAQNLAGIEAALNVYQKFLAADPKTKSKFLDSLEKDRSNGNLEKRIKDLCK